MNYREKRICCTCKAIYEAGEEHQHYKDNEYFFGCRECNKKYPPIENHRA